jgi:hypothetical protein
MPTWAIDLVLAVASTLAGTLALISLRRLSRFLRRWVHSLVLSRRMVAAELVALRHEIEGLRDGLHLEIRSSFDSVYARIGLHEERQNRIEADVEHIRTGLAAIGTRREAS